MGNGQVNKGVVEEQEFNILPRTLVDSCVSWGVVMIEVPHSMFQVIFFVNHSAYISELLDNKPD